MIKICKSCKLEKPINQYWSGKNRGVTYYYNKCKDCDRERQRKKTQRYKAKNREKLAAQQKIYYNDHKKEYKQYNSKYYDKNKDRIKQKASAYIKARRSYDLNFRLKEAVSKSIWFKIKRNKKGNSTIKFLPYSVNDLKLHLESQFEPWMNWDNWGRYNKSKWDDNDSSTWTWNIDHIIPHSKFDYLSMEDENFKKCWALNNLRPLSAKSNILKGSRLI